MKKTILILLSFLTLCALKTPEKGPKTDLQNDNLKGMVKSLTETAYTATYGDSGKAGKGNFEHKYTFMYDKNGNLTGSTGYNKDNSLLDKTTCIIDKKGNRNEMDKANADASPKGKTTYKYDAKGFMAESKEYFSDGSLSDRYTFKYDTNANLVEMRDFNAKDSLILWYKYTYDKQGNNVKTEGFNGVNGLISTIKTEYDDKGNQIKWKGDYSHVNSNDFAYDYKYIYDKNGNWKQRLKFQNGYEIEIVERTIEYYEK